VTSNRKSWCTWSAGQRRWRDMRSCSDPEIHDLVPEHPLSAAKAATKVTALVEGSAKYTEGATGKVKKVAQTTTTGRISSSRTSHVWRCLRSEAAGRLPATAWRALLGGLSLRSWEASCSSQPPSLLTFTCNRVETRSQCVAPDSDWVMTLLPEGMRPDPTAVSHACQRFGAAKQMPTVARIQR
jgi:hypothetical protein